MSQRVSSNLSSRSNFSENTTSEFITPQTQTLANNILSLHEENLKIGKQNQELSVKLHEVTSYNQALGLDIYRLDNEISELEEKIESHREKMDKILHQTEAMNKKTEKCKNSLNRNDQMSELAKKFQKISHFKEKADKQVHELQKIFEDQNFSKISDSFDAIAEKIHFLYWNNNELNEQISMLERMVSEHEDENRAHFKSSWEERRIDKQISSPNDDEIKDENKSESPKSGASLRINMHRRSKKNETDENAINNDHNDQNNKDGECGALPIQSDASKKNEYFMSSDSIGNQVQQQIKNKNITPTPKNRNEITNNQTDEHAIKSPQSDRHLKRRHRLIKQSSETPQNEASNKNLSGSENEYDINEPDDQMQNRQKPQIQFDTQKITPRKRRKYKKRMHQTNDADNNNEEEENEGDTEYGSPKSTSTMYSKSSSKSQNSNKANQSPNACQLNDTSSQLADSSNSSHSNKADNNDEYPTVQLIHSNSKASVQNISDGNGFYSNPKRTPSKRSKQRMKKANTIKDSDSEYDFYESEPPPNPKKGVVRVSSKDPEYEYEYYDPDDNEEADDENEYDFAEEYTAPSKVIIGKPKNAANRNNTENEPKVITNFTEGEYHQLVVSKPKKFKLNTIRGEKFIKLNKKYEDDDEIAHKDKSEYIYIKKSAKTIKEDEERAKRRQFETKIIKPKQSREEMRKERNEILEEEQIKKYEENALFRALEDEENKKQKKIEEHSKLKDEEELFLKNAFKIINIHKKKKREKCEKMKEDEIESYRKNKELEKYYYDKVAEIRNNEEEREMLKAIEEENEALYKKEIKKKAKIRIKNREIEEEANKEEEEQKKQTMKEAEEKLKEEKRLKAIQQKEEEMNKLKEKEKEEEEKKIRDQQKREALLEETKLRAQQRLEELRKKQEEEELAEKERERIIIDDMARRKREKEEKEKQDKEKEKQKQAKEVKELKEKITNFRDMKEKERLEKEENKKNQHEKKLIKERLREKRRKDREQREKERIERQKKEQELRELYDGLFDVPVKRILDKKENEGENSELKNSKRGKDHEGFSSDSETLSNSDSMTELDVVAAVSLEEKKLADLHDKPSHSHSNCKRVKKRKGKNGDEYEYEYEYEYECENENEKEKDSLMNAKTHASESEPEKIVVKDDQTNKVIDESEAEKIAFQEQQRLQQMLQQMDKNKDKTNSNSKNKKKGSYDSSTSKFESDNSIPELQKNSEALTNYKYSVSNENDKNSSEVIEYSDDDYFPRPQNIIVTRKSKNGAESEEKNDENNEKSATSKDDLIIGSDERPLRKKKAEKPEFVPEYYNVKKPPKYVPIVVGTVRKDEKEKKKNKIVEKIENPPTPKPVIIENCKIRHPKSVTMNMKDFEEVKTRAELEKEAAEKRKKEERERIHKERAKKFRHAIDANGKEYEYDYEYDYEYETEEMKKEKEQKEKDTKESNENEKENENSARSKNSSSSSLHATYRDATDFFNELTKEVDNASDVVKQSTDVLKHREEEEVNEKKRPSSKFILKNGVLIEDEEEEETNETNKKHKKVRTGRKIKKSRPSTTDNRKITTTSSSTTTTNTDTNSNTNSNSNSNDGNNVGIRKQKSVTFVSNPNENENSPNAATTSSGGDGDVNRTPPKRIVNSARRQRFSPSSPNDPNSPDSKKRFSTRRRFRDNGEEEEIMYDDMYDEDEESIIKNASKGNNLLTEINSRPDTPRKPPRPPTSPEEKANEEAIANVPSLDLRGIANTFNDSEYEYEYEYEDDNDNETTKKLNEVIHFKIQNQNQETSTTKTNTNNDNNGKKSCGGGGFGDRELFKSARSVEDFTENEKLFDSKENYRLQDLVNRVRADVEMISNEDLQDLLAKINAEIDSQRRSTEELEAKLHELEKVRDHKIPKTLSFWSNDNDNEKVVFPPIDFSSKYKVAELQTDVNGDFIGSIEATLSKQNKEKQEMIAVQKRVEAAQQQAITLDGQIKNGEKQTVEKKQSIEKLKKEIIKVKEEIEQLNYDTTEDDVQAKQCEIEIEKLDTQVEQSQKKLEKVTHTIEELRIKLQEMINYRAVLEAELNDMYNREKPEVRKLIEDVRNSKQGSEEAQTKINQLQKKMATRRDEIVKLRNSQEKKKNYELKIIREKLNRRLKKWTLLNGSTDVNIGQLSEFSVANAAKREKAKNDAYKNMKCVFEKNEENEALSKYADLLESLMDEYNKQQGSA